MASASEIPDQGQSSTAAFNKDVNNILADLEDGKKGNPIEEKVEQDLDQEEEKKEQKSSTTKAGRGGKGRGRGRGNKRGGMGMNGRVTRSKAPKGKIRQPIEGESEEEEMEEGDEDKGGEELKKLTESEKEDEERKDGREEEGGTEETDEEGGYDKDMISLGDEAEFVKDDAHVDREHERYKKELLKHFKKGNTGRYQLLLQAYHGWCGQWNTKPRPLQLLECSSDEEDEIESGTVKRKGSNQSSEKPTKIGKKMNDGTVLSHQLVDLSPYWDSRMTACFGYVPLTIFVPAWLLADKTHMSNRKKQNTSCSDVLQYVGSRVPSEWRQSFLEWSTSFNLCVKYWRAKYNREDVALRLEQHYKIVLEMKAQHHEAWAPALRYDITHRTNVWSHTLPDGSLSDVGTKNKDLMKQAWTDSEANGDHRYIDNPYIVGGALENMCPWTGKYQVGWDIAGSNGMEQVTAVTGGRMLSHLAPTGRVQNQQPFYNAQKNNTTYWDVYRNQNLYDHHEQGSSQTGRGVAYRGRGGGRGNGSRGGNSRGRGAMHPSPTTVVNGVVVPKYGPGAYEAVKAARANAAASGGAAQP